MSTEERVIPRPEPFRPPRFRLAYASPGEGSRGLTRGLGVWTSTAVVVGTMIGTGIFLMPSEVALSAGTLPLALLVWVVGGVLVLLGALTYAELGAALPDAGADYTYLNRGVHPVFGFLYGWRGVLISTPTSMASYAAAIALFSSYLWPPLAQPFLTAGPVSITPGKVLALVLLVSVTAVNLLSVRRVGRIQLALTALKVLALLAVVVAGFLAIGRPKPPEAAHQLEAATYAGFLGGLTAVLWAYSGWRGVLRLGSEIQDPGKNIPRSMFRGFGFTAALFLLVNLACFAALGFSGVAGTQTPVSDAMERTLGGHAADVLTLMMIVSVMGTMNATVLSASRVPFAMAQDGYFFRGLSGLGPTTRAPVVSVLLFAVVATALVTTGSYRQIAGLAVFLAWSFYGLGALALFRLRKLEPDLPRPVRVWGYPIVPGAFLIMAVVLTVYLYVTDPVRSSVGVGVVLAGLFFYRKRAAAA